MISYHIDQKTWSFFYDSDQNINIKYDQKFDQNYHIYLSHYSGLPETEFGTERVLNIQSRPEIETGSILKFSSRIPTGREIPSGLPVPADSLIKLYWIDTYFNLSDFSFTDLKKQFIIKKFKQYVFNMKITVKHVFVKTHHSID